MPMDLKRLDEEVTRSPAAVYLISGSDGAMKERAIELLQSRLCDEEAAEWCLVKVDGKATHGSHVLDLVSTPPFLGRRRVVVVREAEGLEDEERLIPFVEAPPDFATLVLCYEREERKKKLFQAVKKRGKVLEYNVPQGAELPRRVAQLAAEAGLALERDAVELLVERAGDDMIKVEQELEKLAAYAPGARISKEEASRLVASGRPALSQYAIFNFLDALAEGRTGKALEELGALLRAGEPPLLVLSMIARQFRLLYGALAFRGESPEYVASALGLKSIFPAKKALAQATGWSLPLVEGALDLCARCDGAIKSGVDGRFALEELAVRLTEARKRATIGRGSSFGTVK